MKKLVIYDLDGTLAESKSSLDAEMGGILEKLLEVAKVAVISGGDWPQFQKQLLGGLPGGANLGKLSLLPTCGTRFFRHEKGDWTKVYSEDFAPTETKAIMSAFEKVLKLETLEHGQWGSLVEDRGSQITYSALGQQAPLEEKKKWDPDFTKRTKIKAELDLLLPDFSVRMGGSTSIDVTKKGIDKAYGIRKLSDILGVHIDEMLFVGDALFPGGNDYPVQEAGVRSIKVRDPEETKRVTEAMVACLEAPR